jgi:hypothetical protein
MDIRRIRHRFQAVTRQLRDRNVALQITCGERAIVVIRRTENGLYWDSADWSGPLAQQVPAGLMVTPCPYAHDHPILLSKLIAAVPARGRRELSASHFAP